jgi:hypothetical protein
MKIKNRFFIIGNGFDLSHKLPTNFDPDFKEIAIKNESDPSFWDLYQSEGDMWSDFENLLAKPNFNKLEEIFTPYFPDYISDHERDRTSIIIQSEISAQLNESLIEFAETAEWQLEGTQVNEKYKELFCKDDLFLSFNYTHTLEKLYDINPQNVLHIHGELGKSELILGYPDGFFSPEKYFYDPTGNDRNSTLIDINKYIDTIEDYYLRTAYSSLYEKIKAFKKVPQISKLEGFVKDVLIDEIFVIGHSYKIDSPYFENLINRFPNAKWHLYYHKDDDTKNLNILIEKIGIKKYTTTKS